VKIKSILFGAIAATTISIAAPASAFEFERNSYIVECSGANGIPLWFARITGTTELRAAVRQCRAQGGIAIVEPM